MVRSEQLPRKLCGVRRAVVAAQEALAAQVLNQCDTRARFRELFARLYNYPKYGLPAQHGEPGGVLRCSAAQLRSMCLVGTSCGRVSHTAPGAAEGVSR